MWILARISADDARQFGRFLAVGVLNTVVGLSGIAFGQYLLHVSYVWANIIGYGLGVTNSFVWNKLWTFRRSSWRSGEVVRFLVTFGVSYGIQLAVVTLLIRGVGFVEMGSQVAGMCCYTAVNFLLNKFWTFRPTRDAA